MLRILHLLLVASLPLIGCKSAQQVTTDFQVLEITYGTSFGHCRGYCTHELVVTKQLAKYAEISRDTVHFPLKVNQKVIAESFFQELNQSFKMDSLKALPDRVGCPDCADGGSEYVQIVTSTGTKKVTFEYGNIPKSLQSLVALLRIKSKELAPKTNE